MKYGNIDLSVEDVTPTIAARWMELNDVNRRIRPKVVSMYANDMAHGAWELKPIAICFDEQNKLGNGQHTLSAIIASGKPQKILVARNCTREQIAAMDVGLRRSISDVSHFLGVDLARRQAALARILKFGIEDDASRSFSELFDAYVEHQEAIDFAGHIVSSREAGINSATLSVIAMAWYTADRAELSRFVRILSSGVAEQPRDATIIKLRDFCRSLKGGYGTVLRIESFRKTQSALSAYLNNKTLTKVYGVSRQVFSAPKNTTERTSP